jgi:DNA replication licensing factor MCM5
MGNEQCPLDPYVLNNERCTYVDQQILKLQENPDVVPVGELPRHILLTVDRYLANKIVPGARISVTGIFDVFQRQVKVI